MSTRCATADSNRRVRTRLHDQSGDDEVTELRAQTTQQQLEIEDLKLKLDQAMKKLQELEGSTSNQDGTATSWASKEMEVNLEAETKILQKGVDLMANGNVEEMLKGIEKSHQEAVLMVVDKDQLKILAFSSQVPATDDLASWNLARQTIALELLTGDRATTKPTPPLAVILMPTQLATPVDD